MKQMLMLGLILLVTACDKGPNKVEIETLCQAIGVKAFALANDGQHNAAHLKIIEDGAIAECKLKYLTGK